MGEQEIIEALNELEVATAQELSDFVDIGVVSIRNSLNRMLKDMEVEKIELTRTEVNETGIRFSGKHWKWKIKQTLIEE